MSIGENAGQGGNMRAGVMVLVALGISSGAWAQTGEDPKIIGTPGQYFGRDNYPREALRAEEQGRVVTALAIDARGVVTACTVNITSGSSSLDAATCRIARDKMRFSPAKDAQGRAVAGRYTLPVSWALETEEDALAGTIDVATTIPVEGSIDLKFRIRVAADGTVVSCASEGELEMPEDVGHCSSFPVGRKIMPTMTRAGKPIGATIVHRVTMATQYDP